VPSFSSRRDTGEWNKAKDVLSLSAAIVVKVEVELKYFLSYMPIGVLTYPQLRRGLRRSVELGEPWPFVLAVIPTPNKRRKLFVNRRKLFALSWLQSLATRRLRTV
jgi:hypothetical protein